MNMKIPKKEDFYLFDYFGICEFFEKKYDFKKPEKLLKHKKVGVSDGLVEYVRSVSNEDDEIVSSFVREVGAEGFIVDRQGLRESCEGNDFMDDFVRVYEGGDLVRARSILNNFFSEKNLSYDRLSKLFNVKREISVEDVYNFLKFESIKSDSVYFEEKFEEFYSKYDFEKVSKEDIRAVFENYCYNSKIRSCIDRNELGKIADMNFLLLFNNVKQYKEEIVDYILDNNLML